MRYAEVRRSDNVVMNVIEATDEFVAALTNSEVIYITDDESLADIGDIFKDGAFIKMHEKEGGE